MTSAFHSFGEKLVIFLLVAGILANGFGTISIIHNEKVAQEEESRERRIIQEQEAKTLQETANITRGVVTQHNNITEQAFQLLLADKAQSDRLLEPLLRNISETHETSIRLENILNNQTASSARQIDNNNMLKEILSILQNNQTTSLNSTSIVGNG